MTGGIDITVRGPMRSVFHVHKAMRTEADRLVDLAEASDASANIDEIEERLEFLYSFVEEHNGGEEVHIFPALDVLSCNISEPFVWDHDDERRTFEETRDLVRRVKAASDPGAVMQLRRHLIGLRSSLYAHSLKEDEILVPMLDVGVEPAEQGEMIGRITAPKPPEQLLREVRWMVPYWTTDERADFLDIIRAGMPPGAFQGVLDVVAEVVTDGEMDELRERMS